MARATLSTVSILLLGLIGCDDAVTPPTCTMLGGQCVGLPAEAVCADAVCTQGVPCGRVLTASNDAELAGALMQAGGGDCVALAPGSYAAVAVAGGVSLLGRSAGEVRIGALTLGDGSGAWLRGVTVDGGVALGSATGVRIEAARVLGGSDGLRLGSSASVTIVSSQIEGASAFGIYANAAASVTVERSIVAGAGGPGLWVQCPEGSCTCTQKPVVSLDRVLLQKNSGLSVSLIGALASFRHVQIVDTQMGDDFAPGAGLAVSACSSLDYGSLLVKGSQAYGVLIDSSSAKPIGGGLEEQGIIVIDGMPGVWVQRVGLQDPLQQVVLDGLDVRDCVGAGLGFDDGAFGIIVIDGKIAGTQLEDLPVEPIGLGLQANVGLGLVWKAAASADVQNLSISGTAGQAFVIDGPVGPESAIGTITLGGGDEQDGLLQQQVDDTDPAPVTSLQLVRSSEKLADVPVGPDPPPGEP